MNTQAITQEIKYNRAKIWQIAFFAANNMATNCYAVLMMYVSYYANGVAGIAISIVSILLTSLRIFDGITDPIIGVLIDRTEGKYGKFRPYMVIGNIICMVGVLLIFYTTHLIPEGLIRTIYFTIVYMGYIIGYTLQTAVTKAGQTALTNDPKQRPLFSLFDTFMVMFVFGSVPLYVSTVLAKKYGSIGSIGLFHELVPMVIIVSLVCTILAVIGIWSKDCKENFGVGGNDEKIKVKEYVQIIKNNRAIQLLIISTCSDKFALGVATNTTVGIMLYGIMFGDYSMAGAMSLIGMLGGTVITIFGVAQARKMGLKHARVRFTQIALACFTLLGIILLTTGQGEISFKNMGFVTIAYVLIYILGYGSYMVAGNIATPMIADCSDYETYLSGNYIPGVMGTIFSLIDKLTSSLCVTLVGFSVIAIGFDQLPDLTTPYSSSIKYLVIFLFCGLPIIAWIISLIAMKFYPLDQAMMEKVQAKINNAKQV